MSRDLPATLSAWRETYGDLVHLRIWPEHEVVITDPQLARELLVDYHDALIRWERGVRVFSQLHGNSVFVSEGSAWRAKRAALQPAFAPRSVQAFLPAIADATAQALAQWPASAARWPIESAFTTLTMEVILRMTFSDGIGGKADEAQRVAHAVREVSAAANREFYWPASWPDWAPWKRAKRRALADLHGLIDGALRKRLSLCERLPEPEWPDDLLTRLLRLHARDPAAWPLRAVRDECMTAFLAGHETVAATLVWWSWCMASNPRAQAAARAEVQTVLQGRAPTAETLAALPWLTQTLKETLRLYPAAPVLIARRAVRPVTLGGWQFPARTLFMVPPQLMHHDPRWFPEPHAFRPERFGPDAPTVERGAWLPFGAGARVCLGQHLAMAEMTLIAAMLLQRFTLAVPDGMAPPRPVVHVTLRPDQPLHLALAGADSFDPARPARC
jgi:cytochrome P450